MKTLLALLLIILTVFGIMDASYITYEKLSGYVPPCTAQFKCDEVLNSSWASIGPVPLAAFGMLFYSVFFSVSLLFFFEKKTISFLQFSLRTETLLLMLGLFGAGFSLYLLLIMGVILKAWCLYCLLSAATCIILSMVSTTVYLLARKETYDQKHI